jgi:hypothetical protein
MRWGGSSSNPRTPTVSCTPRWVSERFKPAEWRAQYQQIRDRDVAALIKRMKKAGATPDQIIWRLRSEGINPDAQSCFPSFEEIYGIPEHGYVLTRCERQIGGGEVPRIPVMGKPVKEWERLDTVGSLKRRLLEYNPYSDLEIIEAGLPEPARENYALKDWMAGMYLRDRIQREGLQQTRSWLNSHQRTDAKAPGRHANRILESLAAFLPPSTAVDGQQSLSVPELYECHRSSLAKQMAA